MYSMKDKGESKGEDEGISDEEILFDLFLKIEELGYKGWVVAQKEHDLIILGNNPVELLSLLSALEEEPLGDS